MEDNNVLDEKLNLILASKKDIKQAIQNKGQVSNEILADYANQINNIVTLEEGTSDATATSSDIALDKVAYVKGEKITGNINTITASNTFTKIGSIELIDDESTGPSGPGGEGGEEPPLELSNIIAHTDDDDEGIITGGTEEGGISGPGGVVVVPGTDVTPETAQRLVLNSVVANDVLLRKDSNMELYTSYSNVADKIGLTSSVLKKDVKILNITGSLENDYTGTLTPDDYKTCLDISNQILGIPDIEEPGPNETPVEPE